MADSFITSPSLPVKDSLPFPLLKPTSIKRISPPTEVQAKPVTTPATLLFSYLSLECAGPKILFKSSLVKFAIGFSSIAILFAEFLISLEILFSTSGFENGQSVTLDFATSSQGVAFPIIPGCDISQASAVSTRPIVTVETSIDNPLGWYSYKFVVKQTEQEQYNVYLPTTLAGYPCDVTGQEAQGVTFKDDGNIQNPAVPLIPKFEYPKNQESITSHIVLFSDNINKVPRDLQEVGPTQELYRSSQRLYGRVNNIVLSINGRNSISNVGFDPGLNFDVATQVATMTRLGLGDLLSNPAIPIIPNIFYNGETNPAIGVIQTNKQFLFHQSLMLLLQLLQLKQKIFLLR